jgi:lysophospholipase L1-like esterase
MRVLYVRTAVMLAIGALAVLSSCAVQPLLTEAHDGVYVALGDSYAAGPGIPTAGSGPPGCGRSTRNYPSLVNSRAKFAGFRDVTCSGATIADMTTAQSTGSGANPPQLNAVTTDASLVTLTIGVNDVGFAEVLARCLGGSRAHPDGSGCRLVFIHNGHDVLSDRIAALAPKLERVLTDIRRRAPDATVLAVGYPRVLPSLVGGCDEAPFTRADAAYLNDTVEALNTMIEQRAEAAGARYVDTASSSAAHDICRPPDLRWVEGTVPVSAAAPFHPNVEGMENTAGQVLAARLVP